MSATEADETTVFSIKPPSWSTRTTDDGENIVFARESSSIVEGFGVELFETYRFLWNEKTGQAEVRRQEPRLLLGRDDYDPAEVQAILEGVAEVTKGTPWEHRLT